MVKSDLPFGSEFSPSTIDLAETLAIIKANEGNREAFEQKVEETYFSRPGRSKDNQQKLAMNLRLSLRSYGLITHDVEMTDFGKQLYAIRHDSTLLHNTLAKHILLNLHGLSLIQAIKDMQYAGERVTLESLRLTLVERGINVPRGSKNHSMMRIWLEKAGVFRNAWQVDESRLQTMLGLDENEIDALAQLTPEQRAFLKALANIGEDGPYYSNDIEKLAYATYGIRFSEKGLPKTVLYPLESQGYISLIRGTKKPGRGAKPFLVTPTEKFRSEIVAPIIKQFEQQLHADLRPLLRKPMSEILEELKDESRHIKGLALEALAFKLMRLIDLNYVATRLRGDDTGGAEVDVVFQSTRLLFTRWQIQCKNTKTVSLDDVAKEVGLTHFLKSNAVVIVGTGRIGPEARRYAAGVMQDSNLAVILIDGDDVQTIAENPSHIIDVLNREARYAMKLKEISI